MHGRYEGSSSTTHAVACGACSGPWKPRNKAKPASRSRERSAPRCGPACGATAPSKLVGGVPAAPGEPGSIEQAHAMIRVLAAQADEARADKSAMYEQTRTDARAMAQVAKNIEGNQGVLAKVVATLEVQLASARNEKEHALERDDYMKTASNFEDSIAALKDAIAVLVKHAKYKADAEKLAEEVLAEAQAEIAASEKAVDDAIARG